VASLGYRCKSKGVGASAMSIPDLLREMLYIYSISRIHDICILLKKELIMGMNKNTVLGWATFIMIVMGLLLIGLGLLNIETFLVGAAPLVLDFGKRMGFSSLKGRL
jgi:hypothetical protein